MEACWIVGYKFGRLRQDNAQSNESSVFLAKTPTKDGLRDFRKLTAKPSSCFFGLLFGPTGLWLEGVEACSGMLSPLSVSIPEARGVWCPNREQFNDLEKMCSFSPKSSYSEQFLPEFTS